MFTMCTRYTFWPVPRFSNVTKLYDVLLLTPGVRLQADAHVRRPPVALKRRLRVVEDRRALLRAAADVQPAQ